MRSLLLVAALAFTVECQNDRLDPIAEEHMTKSRLWDEHVVKEQRQREQNRKDNAAIERKYRDYNYPYSPSDDPLVDAMRRHTYEYENNVTLPD